MKKDTKTRNEELANLQVTTTAICMNQRAGKQNQVPTALCIAMVHNLPNQIITGKIVPRSEDKPAFKRYTRSNCNCTKVWKQGWWRDCDAAQRPMHVVLRANGKIDNKTIKTMS